jgi:hypothetical protein
MISVCAVCGDCISCQVGGFPIACCECPHKVFEEETGQMCDQVIKDKEVIIIVCPLCQVQIMINNARFL